MVPDGWVERKVEEILSLEYGKSLTESQRQQGSVDVYGSNGIIGIHNESWLKAPGIIVGRKGTVGSVVWAERDFWAIDTTYYVNLKYEVELRWLYFILLQLQLERLTQTTGSPGLNRNDVYRQNIAIPPLPEQKKIAAILSSVDEAIAKTEAVIEQTRKVKQGLLQQLLTRGIGHTKFKDSAVGKIPQGWEVLPLANLCYKITDGSHQAVKTSKDGQIPFLYVSCIRDGKILWENAARISFEVYNNISKGREPSPGVILYTAVGSYGHAALVHNNTPFSFQRHIAYILPNQDKIHSEFISIFLNSSIGRQYADSVAVGNAQKTVTLQQLSSFPVPVPSLAEQKKIIEIISSFENILLISESRLQMLSQIKRGLMQDLLTGRVRVTT